MRVRGLYFGVLKDAFGRGDEEMELAGGASVADLIAACQERPAGAGGVWDSMAVAVHQEYARAADVLKDGDEVALLPPVSGGVGFFYGEGIGRTNGDTADPLRG